MPATRSIHVLFIRAVPSMVKGDTIANIGIPVR
jgi:hypothetical protein